MYTRTVVVVTTIAVVAVVLAAAILRTSPTQSNQDEHGDAAESATYPRGPHGGRLLTGEALQLEMTIYEMGVPPQFRVYPYDGSMTPMAPGDVDLVVTLTRLGGRADRITFTPEGDYLRGLETVEEPHSFDVRVTATHASRPYEWSYEQIEGKVRLGPAQVASAGLVIATAGPVTMQTTLELPGEVKADDTRVAHVVPRLPGVVLSVQKKAGDQVRRGELLVVISSRELAEAKSRFLAASQQAAFARVTVDREEALWKKKISPERDYLEARRAFDEAQLARQLAEQQLRVLGVPAPALPGLATDPPDGLARYEIRAPIAGTVTERRVTTGEAVTADQDMFTIADLSSVWIELSVYAKDLGVVRRGQEAVVLSTDLGLEATGRLDFIGQLVGESTRSAIARLTLSNAAGQWRPGLFVTVRIVRDETTVPLAVTRDAIQTFRDWQVVFVQYGDWFEARPLELGRTDGEWVEVLSGLDAGERYVSGNSFAIKAEIGKLGATHDH